MKGADLAGALSRRRLLTVGGMIAAGATLTACGGGSPVDRNTADQSAVDQATSFDSTLAPASSPPTTEGSMMATEFPSGVQLYGPEDGPAVLVVHPWWGISPGVLAWKDALVTAGARVVLPDLYGGKVVNTIAEAEALSNAIDKNAAFTMLDACADQLNSMSAPWAALGWSLGAFYACQLMDRGEHAPERAVLLYGAAPVSVPTRTKSVQLHIAPGDEYFTDQEIAAALAGFAQAGIAVQRFDYPGLGHWFAEVGSPAYDQEGTRLATERALTFLGLQAGS